MKKATKAAIFVTAAAALYGAAAYGVTRTLMDVAMKREAPKALKNKGSAQLTGEKRDEPYREAQRAAAKKLASSETETVLLENREGLTLVGHLRECEKAKRLVIAFHGWRSAWYRDFGLLADFLSREQCSVLYVEQRAQNESEGDYIGFGLTERYDCVDWANWAAERFPGLPVYLMGVSLGRGDGAHGRRRYSPRRGARRDRRLGLHLAACDLAARDGEEPASSCPRSNRHRRSSVPEEAERLVRQLLHRRGAQKYRCSDFTDPRRGRPLRPAQNGV